MISEDLKTLKQAAEIVGKTEANIRYYVTYNRINRYRSNGQKLTGKAKNGELRISLSELKSFLDLINKGVAKHHNSNLNGELGFYDLPEYECTKHVHRLHPHLGKVIPQLVEWFLSKYFQENDIILDPFMGSGTTLIQGNESGMHTIGIDISEFNCRIAKVKTQKWS